ncbi:MAG TPA: ATP-binding protein [Burkholderiaceae bacterium]|nr:ATP-binding protein [Burkholderiaceae bacterium]
MRPLPPPAPSAARQHPGAAGWQGALPAFAVLPFCGCTAVPGDGAAPAGGLGAAAVAVATAWTLVLTFQFAWPLFGLSRPRTGRALLAYALATSAAALPVWPWAAGLALPACTLAALAAAALLVPVSARAWRQPAPGLRLLAGALWVALGLGVHDLLQLAGMRAPEAAWLLPYASPLLCGVFLLAMQRRHLDAVAQVTHAHASLEARLGEHLGLLHAGWQQLRAAEGQQAVLRERQRLMRDMHDGVGSALMSTLVLVEQGRLDMRGVAELLRECMDDIRLVIDSMEPVGHDLIALLASLRYRLGRRMELSGVRLAWQVGELPRLDWMDAGSALQILRIVQESLTNVLKHAGAKQVALATCLHDDGERHWVRVTITDDGQGFDPAGLDDEAPGRGLRNLRSRARALHGRLIVRSRPGCTEIALDLPVHAAGLAAGKAPISAAVVSA